jgi:hypothetical protein
VSEHQVEVPYGADASDTAVLLLEAAHLLDLDPGVVKTTGLNGFVVPQEVADKAFGKKETDKGEAKPAAKKAAAKKTASKE